MGIPPPGWFIRENPIKMDDLGVRLFEENTIIACECRGHPLYVSNFDGRIAQKHRKTVHVPTTILTDFRDSRLFLHRKAFIAAAISPRADLASGGRICFPPGSRTWDGSVFNMNLGEFCWLNTPFHPIFFLNVHFLLVYTHHLCRCMWRSLPQRSLAPRHLRCSGTLRLEQGWKLTVAQKVATKLVSFAVRQLEINLERSPNHDAFRVLMYSLH